MSQERISPISSFTDLTAPYSSVPGFDIPNTADQTAVEAVEALVLLSEGAPTIEFLIQKAFEKGNSTSETLIYFKKILEINPNNANVLLYSAWCYERLGDFSSAVACYANIQQEHVGGMETLRWRRRAEKRGKKNNELFRQCEEYIRKREFGKAAKALKEILSCSTEHPIALQRLEEVKKMESQAMHEFFASTHRAMRVSSTVTPFTLKLSSIETETSRGTKLDFVLKTTGVKREHDENRNEEVGQSLVVSERLLKNRK